MNVLKALTFGLHSPEALSRTRVLPSQPPGVPPGKVYAGHDMGFIDYQGERPQAGDMVVITGTRAQLLCSSGNAVPPLTDPLLDDGCLCKCPSASGLAYYMGSVAKASSIHVINVQTGALVAMFGMADILFGRGLAVDPASPYTLYVLDDRRILREPTITGVTVPDRGYFTVITFTIGGGAYSATAYTDMTDPFPVPVSVVDYPSIGIETQDTDPPNFTTNGLSVISGLLHLTMYAAPARYLTMTGGVFTSHNLTLNGVNYTKGLRGQIVTIPDKPAKRTDRWVIASNGTDYELLRFDVNNAIQDVITLESSPRPRQLATVCNQLTILHGATAPLLPSQELGP